MDARWLQRGWSPENDLISSPSEAAALAADYGTDGAELVILEGVAQPEIRSTSSAAYWQEVLDFLDPRVDLSVVTTV